MARRIHQASGLVKLLNKGRCAPAPLLSIKTPSWMLETDCAVHSLHLQEQTRPHLARSRRMYSFTVQAKVY